MQRTRQCTTKIISLILLLSLYLFIDNATWADYRIEIIDLKGRTADEIIPIIKPFINPDGSITGTGYQLVLRTSSKNVQEVKNILKKIDRPPRRLLIHVRQGAVTDIDKRHLSAGINKPIGSNGQIIVGDPTPPDSTRVKIKSTSTKSNLDNTHTVQALEGKAAFIATGVSIPINSSSDTIIGGSTVQRQRYTQYQDVTSGFYVIPRINGEQVSLAITTRQDRPGNNRDRYGNRDINIQHAETQVSGKLGEWIPIGGIERNGQVSQNSIIQRSSTKNRVDRGIALLVEELH
ncbi:MAG: hypothetical protein GY696_06360 [Gammaproteobacteria bacterium]|nr:hypothetical protein [Gammaproteobacteria bacterium]